MKKIIKTIKGLFVAYLPCTACVITFLITDSLTAALISLAVFGVIGYYWMEALDRKMPWTELYE